MLSRDEVVQGKLQQILAMLAGFTADINYAWLKDKSPSGESGLMQMARYPQYFSKILSLFAHLAPWQKKDLLQQSNKHFSGSYFGAYMQLPAMASHRQTLISMVERERLLPEVQRREKGIHRFRGVGHVVAVMSGFFLLAQSAYVISTLPSMAEYNVDNFGLLQAEALPSLLFALLLLGCKQVSKLHVTTIPEVGQRAYAALLGRPYRRLTEYDLVQNCYLGSAVSAMMLMGFISSVFSIVFMPKESPLLTQVGAALLPIIMSIANMCLVGYLANKLQRLEVLAPAPQRLMAAPGSQRDRAVEPLAEPLLAEVLVQPARHLGMEMGR
jgi:hypothetical protein